MLGVAEVASVPGTAVGETEVEVEVAVDAELGTAGAVVVGTDVVGAAVDMEAVLDTVPVDAEVPAAVDPLVGGDAVDTVEVAEVADAVVVGAVLEAAGVVPDWVVAALAVTAEVDMAPVDTTVLEAVVVGSVLAVVEAVLACVVAAVAVGAGVAMVAVEVDMGGVLGAAVALDTVGAAVEVVAAVVGTAAVLVPVVGVVGAAVDNEAVLETVDAAAVVDEGAVLGSGAPVLAEVGAAVGLLVEAALTVSHVALKPEPLAIASSSKDGSTEPPSLWNLTVMVWSALVTGLGIVAPQNFWLTLP